MNMMGSMLHAMLPIWLIFMQDLAISFFVIFRQSERLMMILRYLLQQNISVDIHMI